MRPHLDQAAEAIRAANHATTRGPLPANEASGVVGDLAVLAGRLPQLLDHLLRSLHRAEPTGYYDDRGTDPAPTLDAAHGHVDQARAHAAGLAHHLDHAHNHLGHIGRRLPED